MSKKKQNVDITKAFTPMSDAQAKKILKTQQPLTLKNVRTPQGAYPHMNNLTADVYTNEAFKQFQQFKNFRNLGNIVFYKSANGKQLEVCFGSAGEVVWVESAHNGVDVGGEEVPAKANEDKTFEQEIEPGTNEVKPEQKRKPITTIQVPNKEPITPVTKKASQTKAERLEKTYNNESSFKKRVDKIKKGWNVKDKTIETYSKIAKKSKNIIHPSNLLDKIKDTYTKFKQSRNKFNFFQTYKKKWEKVKRAYNITATLEELIEDLI